MRGFLLRFFVILICGRSQGTFSSTKVVIEENGYSGIVIAIHPDVEESVNLVEAIEEVWTNASRDLYVATTGLTYFKKISILLPRTWTTINATASIGTQTYDQADIVVARQNDDYGDQPYTLQYSGCGYKGLRSHFTPDYLLDSNQNYYSEDYRGKAAVKAWAHYRWGVFNETSTENRFYWDPNFDMSQGPQATKCPRDLTGDVINSSSTTNLCTVSDVDPSTNTYPDSCVFQPDQTQTSGLNSSLMAYSDISNITTFCHDEGDGNKENAHNIYAPNDQNRLCNLKSTWTVIQESSDFSDISTSFEIVDTTPQFEIIKTLPLRFILIIDDSANMNEDKLDAFKKSVNQFITVTAPEGSSIGILKYSTEATVLANMTLLDSDNTRNELLDKILYGLEGKRSCCISCGIAEGIKMLESGVGTAGSHMVVITGDQGGGVYAVYDELLDKNIIVHGIFIDTNANDELNDLSDDSGGDWFETKTTADLQAALNRIAASDSTQSIAYQVEANEFEMQKGDSLSSVLYLDSSLGEDTTFFFTYTEDCPVITIYSPDHCVYTNKANSTERKCDDTNTGNVTGNTIKFKLSGTSPPGEWTYSIESEESKNITSSVTSLLSSSSTASAITLESGTESISISGEMAATIHVKVTQGQTPMENATIIAQINRPNEGSTIYLQLFDNGAGADIQSGDGIYSRYFTYFTGQGRYSIEITASKGEATQTLTKGSCQYTNEAESEKQRSSNYERSTENGSFARVQQSSGFSYNGDIDYSSTSSSDVFPPGTINDVTIQQKDPQDNTKGVVLQFTSTGNDLDVGRASKYNIFYYFDTGSSTAKESRTSYKVDQSDVLTGNLSDPQEFGEPELFVVTVSNLPVGNDNEPYNESWLAFEVQAVDSAGNSGNASNTALTAFFITTFEEPSSTAATTVTTSTINDECECKTPLDTERQLEHFRNATIALGVITGVFFIIIVILAFFVWKYRKERKYKVQRYDYYHNGVYATPDRHNGYENFSVVQSDSKTDIMQAIS